MLVKSCQFVTQLPLIAIVLIMAEIGYSLATWCFELFRCVASLAVLFGEPSIHLCFVPAATRLFCPLMTALHLWPMFNPGTNDGG
jgi:ABC-type polysaccharide/polyol phosphate export permease